MIGLIYISWEDAACFKHSGSGGIEGGEYNGLFVTCPQRLYPAVNFNHPLGDKNFFFMLELITELILFKVMVPYL